MCSYFVDSICIDRSVKPVKAKVMKQYVLRKALEDALCDRERP